MTRFTWPNGAQCAAALTFDMDGETIPFVTDAARGHERLTLISTATYGPAVGTPRILDVLRQAGIRATFFIPGFTAERHPDLIRRMLDEGHEVGCHGYYHERPDRLSDEQEADVLARSIEVIARLTGRQPAGYRSPAWELKPGSPGLLKRNGFLYDSSLMGDDIPYLVSTPDGELVELPIQWILDDYPHFAVNLGGISSPQKVFEVWASEFDGYHRYNGSYVLTMHPFVSGRPSRVMLIEHMIEHINARGNVWWATLEEMARYSLESGQCRTWTPPALPGPDERS